MRSPTRLPDLVPIVAGVGTVLYPVLVYFGLPHVPPGPLVVVAIGLGALHVLHRQRRAGVAMPRWSIVLMAAVLLGILLLLALRPMLAVQAYPLIINLSLAAIFAWSLVQPPSAIERIARLTKPDLSSQEVGYTRTVTKVWLVFFLINACITSVCAVWFTVAIWSLWTGLVSYLLIGALFAVEVMVRRRVLPRPAL
ncbi:MAG: hypothetical protein ABSC95_19815 [Acetobacteraceae bacterium]|jgi:uncharacterized membrane protein